MAETIVTPAPWNFTMYQGDTFSFKFTVLEDGLPVDLSTAVVRAQVRETELDPAILATFTVVSTGADGVVQIELPAADTQNLISGQWDCEITNAGVTRTYLRGTVTVLRDISR